MTTAASSILKSASSVPAIVKLPCTSTSPAIFTSPVAPSTSNVTAGAGSLLYTRISPEKVTSRPPVLSINPELPVTLNVSTGVPALLNTLISPASLIFKS